MHSDDKACRDQRSEALTPHRKHIVQYITQHILHSTFYILHSTFYILHYTFYIVCVLRAPRNKASFCMKQSFGRRGTMKMVGVICVDTV